MPKNKELTFDAVSQWLIDTLGETAGAAHATLIKLTVDMSLPTSSLSDDDGSTDDNAASDEAVDLFQDAPWQSLEKDGLKKLAATLELTETKRKDIKEALATLWETKKGKKAIQEALGDEDEGAAEEKPAKGDKGKDKPGKKSKLNLTLAGVSKAAFKAANDNWGDSDDKAGFAYLKETYSTGSYTAKKAEGALDTAIRADALWADLEEVELEALETALDDAGTAYNYPKGANPKKKKEVLQLAAVVAAIDSQDA